MDTMIGSAVSAASLHTRRPFSLPVPQTVLTAEPGASLDPARHQALRTIAREYESMFLGRMLQQMYATVGVDETFGGGSGEQMFRDLLVDEYGKQAGERGGIGLADGILRELIRAQEG